MEGQGTMRDSVDTTPMSKPMVVQVIGPAGAGKSFFAKRFAKTFGAPIISRDLLRWTLFAHHTYSKDEESIISQVSEVMVDELLKTGKLFILDGGYNRRPERNAIRDKAYKNNYQVFTIIVQTDEPTARQRAEHRSARSIDDRYNQSLSPEQYTAQLKAYQSPVVDKNTVVISGKHTYSTQARIVLKKLVEVQEAPSTIPARPKVRPVSAVRSFGPFIQ